VQVNYDGVRFREPGPGPAPGARYHQRGDLVWAEFAGGRVRRGSLVGTCSPDGVLTLAYCMVLADGAVISGRSTSTPQRLADGRIRLTEQWERYPPHAGRGVSHLEQVPEPAGRP